MATNRRIAMLQEAMARYRAGKISRRQAVGLLGALGLSTSSASWLLNRGAEAKSAPGGAHAGHMMPVRQEGTPGPEEGPPPVVTPQLGERPDGGYVWRVLVGGGNEEELIETEAFFPEEITINAGDAVYFEMRGFHTVTLLSGQEAPPFLVPDMTGGTPAAGPPRLILNPEAAFPSGGDTYDGTGVVNSGVPLDPSAPPFTLTFTAPGTYEYVCLVHPNMKARVVVQEQGAERPNDQAAYDQLAAEQEAQLIERGRALIERHSQATPTAGAGGGNVVEVAAGVGEDRVEALRFVPDRVEVNAGDTVRWTNRAATDPHTVTFLGGGSPPEFILVEPAEGGPPKFVLSPEAVQPAGGPTYGGQGFANSGLLVEEGGFPTTYELTFDTPGEYQYLCLIHAGAGEGGALQGMVGTVVVS